MYRYFRRQTDEISKEKTFEWLEKELETLIVSVRIYVP